MSTLLHVSDPHFGTERPDVVEALRGLVHELSPDMIILSGDLTQRARRAQFRAARAFIDACARPTLVIPGNHDVPLYNVLLRVWDPFRHYRTLIAQDMEPVLESDDVLAIGVNTVCPRRHKDGEVSDAQIRRVSERLRAARPHQLRIVVTHQPVHVIRQKDLENLLINREAAMAAWSAAGADLILGGHIHLPYVRPLNTPERALPREVWSVQAGTALSTRIRDGISNSVHVLKHDGEARTCLVEQWDYDEGATRFAPGPMTTIPLDR